jgi:hypothetical protein
MVLYQPGISALVESWKRAEKDNGGALEVDL